MIANTSTQKFVIFIDPGHGGFDGGCESEGKEFVEKDIALDASLLLAHYLRSSGYVVYLTRYNDKALANNKKEDIHKRVDLINQSSADIYISIHVNSYPSKVVRGAQVFYQSNNDKSKLLSNLLMNKIKELDPNNNRSALTIKNKYLVDHVKKTGCLIELGFLSNNEDLQNLTSNIYMKDMCMMLYLGIVEYLEYYK